ncbi:unnamed protein product, partial [marine sediment metagenome]
MPTMTKTNGTVEVGESMTRKKIHYLQLDSILMVERKIQEMDYPIKTELWRALPKKVTYQTFSLII